MLLFWNLFQVSISRMRRSREFRADGIAAEVTSPEGVVHALMKTTAYSRYRGKIENQVLEKNRVQEELNFRSEIANGFVGFV